MAGHSKKGSSVHVLDAMKTLDDILRRMQAHHSKKQPMLRQFKLAHGLADDPQSAPIELPMCAQNAIVAGSTMCVLSRYRQRRTAHASYYHV